MSHATRHRFEGQNLAIERGLFRIAHLYQELYDEIDSPSTYIKALKTANLPIDLFTFLDSFPQESPQYPYFAEWDNFAAIRVSSFREWFENLPKKTRRRLRRASDYGIVVRWVEFDDGFVEAVRDIFNECPVRQGRPFWHYGKTFNEVKEILSRDMERSRYLGAFVENKLIGFVKLISGRNFLRTALIISLVRNRIMNTNNAMIARAVEICETENVDYLVYGKIEYGNLGNRTLAEFKENNGFTSMKVPRYYVPLTLWGRVCLSLGMQHGIIGLLPRRYIQLALQIRAKRFALPASNKTNASDAADE